MRAADSWMNADVVAPPPQRLPSTMDVPGGCPSASCSPSSESPTNTDMSGIQKIAAERTRQIEDERWTPEHDATEHAKDNALLMAANSYLAHAIGRAWVYDSGDKQNYRKQKAPFCWPDGWKWKPKSPEKDLIRAGALIAAHLDMIGGLDSQNAEIHGPRP